MLIRDVGEGDDSETLPSLGIIVFNGVTEEEGADEATGAVDLRVTFTPSMECRSCLSTGVIWLKSDSI
jgi:hypothetical protein